ncbi:hypothetical protein D3C75_548300 [compost metagenome]
MLLVFNRLVRGRQARAACFQLQQAAARPFCAQVKRLESVSFRNLTYNYGASPVAEQHTGITVCVVGDAGKRIRPDNERIIIHSCLDEACCCCQTVDKTRACSRQVKRRCTFCSQLILQDAGSGRERGVRCYSGNNNEVKILCLHPSGCQRLQCSLIGQIRSRLMRCRNMPLTDTCTADNPFIIGFYDLFKIAVSQYFLRHIFPCTDNPYRTHLIHIVTHFPLISLDMPGTSPACSAIRACLTAFLTALPSDEPWPFTTRPLRPSSGAPPCSL